MSHARPWTLLCVAIATVSVLLAAAARYPAVRPAPDQDPTTVVAVEPALVLLPVGGTTQIRVAVENPANLIAFEIEISFDASVVEINDSDADAPGVQVTMGALLDGREHFPVANTVDNEAGRIYVAVTLLGIGSALNESGDLIAISVSGEAAGTTPLTLTRVVLADAHASLVPAQLVNGTIIVGTDITVTPDPTSTPSPTRSPTATPTNTPPGPTTTRTATPTASSTPAFSNEIQLPLLLRDFQTALPRASPHG